jgi:GxxExxY protein
MLQTTPLVHRVIGLAIDVHRALGPGLLESAYQHCLVYELRAAGVPFTKELQLPLRYREAVLDSGYRLDLVIENQLIVEVKSVDRLLPIHSAQVLTYLKLARLKHALLLNFNVELMRHGIKSLFNSAGTDRIHM